MSGSTVSTPAVSSSSERFTGRVKWFNNKAGYGFITVTDGSKSGTDVFVHHSSIKVDSEQYKYLVQGEYVDFTLSNTNGEGEHEFQAGEVCGIKGGKLMCETRRDSRVARSQYRSARTEDNESSEPVKMPRSVVAPKEQRSQGQGQRQARVRGQGPREEGGEWTYVAKTRNGQEPSKSTQTPRVQRTSGGRGTGRAPRAGRGEGKTQSS
jgi:CspA family cold shock protein